MATTTKRIIGIFIGLFFLSFTGCSSANKPNQSSSDMKPGVKEMYANHCASCHGGNLEGGFGPPLQGIGKKLNKKELLHIMQKGRGSMPAQDYVAKEDREKLATWLVNQK